MRRFLIVLLTVVFPLAAADDRTNGLTQFSGALERLAGTVGPAVVQVQVSAWCAAAQANGDRHGRQKHRHHRQVAGGISSRGTHTPHPARTFSTIRM